MIKKLFMGLAVLFAVICIITVMNRPTHAQSQADNSDILKKLDAVLNNQKTILAEISSISEELKIIKIRVTQAQ
jgi:hypothetical protein